MLNTVRRVVVIGALAAVAVVAGPGSASAAPGDHVGGLMQFASPNDCISDLAASGCGTQLGGGLGSAHGVAISSDGKNVYVAAEGGALSTFNRNTAVSSSGRGVLSFAGCIKDPTSTQACTRNSPNAGDLAGAHSVAVTSDGKFVYVAASTSTTDSITVFSRNLTTGALTPITSGTPGNADECISEEVGACRFAAGLKGTSYLTVFEDSVYAVSPGQSTVVRLTRDSPTGVLTQPSAATDCFRGTGSPAVTCGAAETPGLKGASQTAVTPDGKNLYVASRGSSAVTRFTRVADGAISGATCVGTHGNDPNTDCTPGAPLGGLNGAQAIVAVTDTNIYVASGPGSLANTGNALVTLTRNPADGSLVESQCYRELASTAETACATGTTVGLKGADAIAITADGSFLYVAGGGALGDDVAEFSRNTGNGFVAPLPPVDNCIAEASNTDCDPTNRGAKGIGGASSLVTGPPGSANYLYVTGPNDDAVAEFRIQRAAVCTPSGITAPRDTTTPGDLRPRCTDPNGDMLTFSKVSGPTNGHVTVHPDGTFTYTPTPGFQGGTDSFRFKAFDGHVDSNVAKITIIVPSAAADTTKPVVTLTNVPTHVTRSHLLNSGIQFTERADEKVVFDNELRSSRAELGFGPNTNYNIVLKEKSFAFGTGPHNVTLKPHASDIGSRQTFKVKIRITATDGSGNRRRITRTVQVSP